MLVKSFGGMNFPFQKLAGYYIEGNPLGMVHVTEATFSKVSNKVTAYV
jgi:hypothetical protein